LDRIKLANHLLFKWGESLNYLGGLKLITKAFTCGRSKTERASKLGMCERLCQMFLVLKMGEEAQEPKNVNSL
jgi:hypothetical protein